MVFSVLFNIFFRFVISFSNAELHRFLLYLLAGYSLYFVLKNIKYLSLMLFYFYINHGMRLVSWFNINLFSIMI